MLKNILKLGSAQQLTNSEQKTINGGGTLYWCSGGCSAGYYSKKPCIPMEQC